VLLESKYSLPAEKPAICHIRKRKKKEKRKKKKENEGKEEKGKKKRRRRRDRRMKRTAILSRMNIPAKVKVSERNAFHRLEVNLFDAENSEG
jgi:hypothetical protein